MPSPPCFQVPLGKRDLLGGPRKFTSQMGDGKALGVEFAASCMTEAGGAQNSRGDLAAGHNQLVEQCVAALANLGCRTGIS